MRLAGIAGFYDDLTPDDLYPKPHEDPQDGDVVSFVYMDGRMYYGRSPYSTHADIIMRNMDDFRKKADPYNVDLGMDDNSIASEIRADKMEKYSVTGRVGSWRGMHMVRVWNVGDHVRREEMVPCLQTLYADNKINDDTMVGIPGIGTKSYGEMLNALSNEKATSDQREVERIEQLKRLHLMPPNEKKAAIRKLGLIGGGHKTPQQKEAERAGLTPGKKWWAMASEGR